MISKSPQNMAILDDDIKFSQNMDEMPKNLSLDKTNCDNSCEVEMNPDHHHPHNDDDTSEKDIMKNTTTSTILKNSNNDKSIIVKEFPSETRIQLSFSVDRLLNDQKQKSTPQHSEPPQDSHNDHGSISDKCCDEMNSGYACCSLPNCLVNSSSPSLSMTSSSVTYPGNSYQNSLDEDMQQSGAGSSYMDFKSIVRPTPVRALGNNSESVPTLTHFSALPPTALIRFHHAQLQQKQLSQHLPAQPTFNLTSLMNPLCGLKPLQMNAQQMGLQNFTTSTQRFNTKGPINFDIPIGRPNLTCISTLRHHHLPSANSTDSHMNFNTTPATSTAGNTPASNTNSSNSHANISSGGKRKRSWSRAVFSNLQRKGLEIQFQQQKYITKPDRRKLAARLNLTDAQVKVWFQNRRMKWRHTRENLKSGQEKQPTETPSSDSTKSTADNMDTPAGHDLPGYSSDGSSSIEMSDVEEDDDEIDVVE